MPFWCQGIDVAGGMAVPRVSRPGCPAEAGSRLDPATELILRDRAGNGGIGKHTLRTVVHEIMLAEQGIARRAACVLL